MTPVKKKKQELPPALRANAEKLKRGESLTGATRKTAKRAAAKATPKKKAA